MSDRNPFAGLTRWQAFWYGVVPLSSIIGLLMAMFAGIYGWQGKGLPGELATPRVPGMLVGVLVGLMFGVVFGIGLAVAIWAGRHWLTVSLSAVFWCGYILYRYGWLAASGLALVFILLAIYSTYARKRKGKGRGSSDVQRNSSSN